jgi:hypothetical protein
MKEVSGFNFVMSSEVETSLAFSDQRFLDYASLRSE